MSGDIQNSHDPVLVEVDGRFVSFSTGGGLSVKTSSDMLAWTWSTEIFGTLTPFPSWQAELVPEVDGLWAPDVSTFGDEVHIYYAAGTFGSGRACIGHLTRPSFESGDFVDRGPVICSNVDSIDFWNAIDPNVILDEEGMRWLAFGSYGSGIKLIQLDSTGDRANDDMYTLAARPTVEAIEAPFIARRCGFYYLFVSWDKCCMGADSTYNIRVGRSENILGPYVDANGAAMLDGGGTPLLEGNDRWRGPGHNAIFVRGTSAYNVYHAYDAENGGIPTLRISDLVWDSEGWPISGGP